MLPILLALVMIVCLRRGSFANWSNDSNHNWRSSTACDHRRCDRCDLHSRSRLACTPARERHVFAIFVDAMDSIAQRTVDIERLSPNFDPVLVVQKGLDIYRGFGVCGLDGALEKCGTTLVAPDVGRPDSLPSISCPALLVHAAAFLGAASLRPRCPPALPQSLRPWHRE